MLEKQIPEAPVFYPTLEEAYDPIAYISSIASVASKYGICKICLPKNIQLFSMYVKDKYIDMYRLWRCVNAMGGFNHVCDEKLWPQVCDHLQLDSSTQLCSALTAKYRTVILPFDCFKDQLRTMVCIVCRKGNDDENLLICDQCKGLGACHTYCLNPPLSGIPKGAWSCPRCIAKRFKKLHNPSTYGFQRSSKRHTLQSFHDQADRFKTKHFNRSLHNITADHVETEFWRLIQSDDTEIVVEYGADLNVNDFTSGFPTSKTTNRSASIVAYRDSPWNLNNLSILPNSALRFLSHDISGMITPWVYVGMVFSCFCWHIEDNWSNSINFLHTGSPKTWYGIPSSHADAFEAALHSEVPDLLADTPDLLHHLTTLMSPWLLLNQHNVPVYRCDQKPGDFIVTFPRAYHAGFNHGFNFAEAVNFCPVDWFDMGQACILNYALTRRRPVFSHAELLIRMAQSIGKDDDDAADDHHQPPMSVDFLAVAKRQLAGLLDQERRNRGLLARLGVRHTERFDFAIGSGDSESVTTDTNGSDDEVNNECRQCHTTLFLSGLGCKCRKGMLCLADHESLTCCARDQQLLRYRYDLVELSDMIDRLDVRLDEFNCWQRKVDALPCIDLSLSCCEESEKEAKDQPKVKLEEESTASGDPGGESKTDNEESTDKLSIDYVKGLLKVGQSRQYPKSSLKSIQFVLSSLDQACSIVEDLLLHHTTDSDSHDESTSDFLSPVKSESSEHHQQRRTSGRRTAGRNRRSDPPSRYVFVKLKRDSVKPPVVDKLSLDEFTRLTSLIRRHPIEIPHSDDFFRLADRIGQWRAKVTAIINQSSSSSSANQNTSQEEQQNREEELPSLTLIDQLLEFPESVKIDLREVIPLKRLRDCIVWINSVDGYVMPTPPTSADDTSDDQSDDKPSLDDLQLLQLEGDRLSSLVAHLSLVKPEEVSKEKALSLWMGDPLTSCNSNRLIDSALIDRGKRLLELINKARLMEVECKQVTEAKPGTLLLEEALATLNSALALPVQLDAVDQLASLCSAMQNIERQLEFFSRLLTVAPFGTYLLDDDLPNDSIDELSSELGLGRIDCSPALWNSRLKGLERTNQAMLARLPQLDVLREKLDRVKQARDDLHHLFVSPKSTKFSLLEILLPRSSADLKALLRLDESWMGESCTPAHSIRSSNSGSPIPSDDEDGEGDDQELSRPRHRNQSQRRKQSSTASVGFNATAYASLRRENAQVFARATLRLKRPDLAYASLYEPLVGQEVTLMRQLRTINNTKSKAKNQNKVVYCICRQPGFSGFMLQCEVCRDWFHGKCVSLPALKPEERERLKYACPRCCSSTRPDLEQLVRLLASLQADLPIDKTSPDPEACANYESRFCFGRLTKGLATVRLPELLAAQLLCERAFAFIRHLRVIISSNVDLKAAISAYEKFSSVKMPLDGCHEIDLTRLDSQQQSSMVTTSTADQSSRSVISSLLVATNSSNNRDDDNNQSADSIHIKPDSPSSDLLSLAESSHLCKNVPSSSSTAISPQGQGEAAAVEALTSLGKDRPVTPARQRSEEFPDDRSTVSSRDDNRKHRLFNYADKHTSLKRPRQSSTMDQFSSSGSKRPRSDIVPTRRFFYRLPDQTRLLLENLLMEASLLEVNLPQTRWLWQLYLATDPDQSDDYDSSLGALAPNAARVEELKLRFRFHKHLRPKSDEFDELLVQLGQEEGDGSTYKTQPSPFVANEDIKSNASSSMSSFAPESRRHLSSQRKRKPRHSPDFISTLGRSIRSPPPTGSNRRSRGGSGLSSAGRGSRRPVQSASSSIANRSLSKLAGMRYSVAKAYHQRYAVTQHQQQLEQQNHESFVRRRMLTSNWPGHRMSASNFPGFRRRGRVRRSPLFSRGRGRAADMSPTGSAATGSDEEFEEDFDRPDSNDQAFAVSMPSTTGRGRGRGSRGPRRATSRGSRLSNRSETATSLRGGHRRAPVPVRFRLHPDDDDVLSGFDEDEDDFVHASDQEDAGEGGGDGSDRCSASSCRGSALGSVVEWIACDGCGDWFHQICVGIQNKSQVPEMYICLSCRRISSSSDHATDHHHRSSKPPIERTSGAIRPRQPQQARPNRDKFLAKRHQQTQPQQRRGRPRRDFVDDLYNARSSSSYSQHPVSSNFQQRRLEQSRHPYSDHHRRQDSINPYHHPNRFQERQRPSTSSSLLRESSFTSSSASMFGPGERRMPSFTGSHQSFTRPAMSINARQDLVPEVKSRQPSDPFSRDPTDLLLEALEHVSPIASSTSNTTHHHSAPRGGS